ncbi:15681_t:CDS:10 [Cetraspora pellucida]|uniref:Ubiquitin-activating enzyme E1-like n=1 Tax=Cetraspora pellucida TaxID=1433469 RepID=A0A9N9JSP2_9GLOM|nr:15681_t:CDS:10 [Cetraspora pellucida]
MPRFSHYEAALGSQLFEKIRNCRVLMVGAGGIGCELLKNLVMSGFNKIELVDLDTIDLSNLNRQFLFQKQHIKKSKAQVARESALKFNPNASIVAHHANIKDPQFNIEWFKSFDIVMNALDNLDARRHVNTMCLVANIPLVESGSEGYLGQVTIIKKGETECYECQPKPTRKTYPVCTIRSTPSSPIHCIVWAKSYLFNQLFGIPEDEDEELDKELNDENANEIANLKAETLALKRIREAMGSQEYPKITFQKIFNDDINRLLTMEDMWKTRKPPATNPDASLTFDKDDIDAIDFITATSNLRARIFGIEEKTRFQVKAMAGNIIPAIATTNAIVAGMIVMQAFKVLNGDFKECKTVYCSPDRRPKSILSESLNKPNVECSVCQSAHVTLNVNVKKVTLRDFLKEVVQGHDEDENDICEVSVEEGGRIIYDVEYDDNLDATFEKLNITDGKMVKVTPENEDEENCPTVFAITHRQSPNTWFQIDGDIAPRFHTNANSNAHKRKLDDSEVDPQEESSRKRPAVIENEVIVQDDDLIMTEDGPQRLIVID